MRVADRPADISTRRPAKGIPVVDTPHPVFLEIIERRSGSPDGSLGSELVVPNEVRLNGQPLAMPQGRPIDAQYEEA